MAEKKNNPAAVVILILIILVALFLIIKQAMPSRPAPVRPGVETGAPVGSPPAVEIPEEAPVEVE
ncbi:MAG: hypothetical protein GX554_01305 [Elusimicrobia bacterium]|nr:hypothetical protein [Elusimicrobiota bacterium]